MASGYQGRGGYTAPGDVDSGGDGNWSGRGTSVPHAGVGGQAGQQPAAATPFAFAARAPSSGGSSGRGGGLFGISPVAGSSGANRGLGAPFSFASGTGGEAVYSAVSALAPPAVEPVQYVEMPHDHKIFLNFDETAAGWWGRTLGEYGADSAIPWEVFAGALDKGLPGQLLDGDLKTINILLVNSGHVTLADFANFLRWFGSFSAMPAKVRSLALNGGAAWFYGRLSGGASTELLEANGRPGGFLLRFSQSEAERGGFALAVLNHAGVVVHVNAIYNAFAIGEATDEFDGIIHFEEGRRLSFRSLAAFVEHIKLRLFSEFGLAIAAPQSIAGPLANVTYSEDPRESGRRVRRSTGAPAVLDHNVPFDATRQFSSDSSLPYEPHDSPTAADVPALFPNKSSQGLAPPQQRGDDPYSAMLHGDGDMVPGGSAQQGSPRNPSPHGRPPSGAGGMVFSRLAVSVPLDSGGVATSTHTPSEGAYAEFSPIRSRPQSAPGGNAPPPFVTTSASSDGAYVDLRGDGLRGDGLRGNGLSVGEVASRPYVNLRSELDASLGSSFGSGAGSNDSIVYTAETPRPHIQVMDSPRDDGSHTASLAGTSSSTVSRLSVGAIKGKKRSFSTPPIIPPEVLSEALPGSSVMSTPITSGQAAGVSTTVWAWGFGQSGQLGVDSYDSFPRPVPLIGLQGSEINAAEAGANHCLAVSSSTGAVFGWGANKYGQACVGRKSDGFCSATPCEAIAGDSSLDDPVVRAAAGDRHTFLLTQHGSVYAVGYPDKGRLGVGDRKKRLVPTLVPALQPSLLGSGDAVVRISTCRGSAAAVTANGVVYVWGAASAGQLGVGTDASGAAPKELRSPVVLEALLDTPISCAAMGEHHAVFVTLVENKVFATGTSEDGALGLGAIDHVDVPTEIKALRGLAVRRAAAGWRHSVAVLDDGRVFAWGANGAGQLGLGDQTDRPLPTYVTSLADVEDVSDAGCGPDNTAVITSSGAVYTAGASDYGQLGRPVPGDTDADSHAVPANVFGRVATLDGRFVVSVSVGEAHMVALAHRSGVGGFSSQAAEGGGGGGGGGGGDLSAVYWREHMLNYNHIISEATGVFYDAGRQAGFTPLDDLRAAPLNDTLREVILVDLGSDAKLQALIDRARAACAARTDSPADALDDLSRAKVLALLVSDTLGGSSNPSIARACFSDVSALRQRLSSNVIPLGEFRYGLCRHRALLFKVLADAVGVPCRLIRGSYSDPESDGGGGSHAWNVVWIRGSHYLVDVMYEPSQTYEASSPEALRYERATLGGASGGMGAASVFTPDHLASNSQDGVESGLPPSVFWRHGSSSSLPSPVAGMDGAGSKRIDFSFDVSEVQGLKVIGQGGFGTVERGTWDGIDVAVKRLAPDVINDDAREDFLVEMGVLKNLSHPNIVLFIGACTTPPDLVLVTEFVDRGSLWDNLRNPDVEFDEARKLSIAKQSAAGMSYLHNHADIIHRDLKSLNLLITSDWNVKVADFGLSRIKLAHEILTGRRLGSYQWMSPELFDSSVPYSDKVDVYAFAVVLWELVTGDIPYLGMAMMDVVSGVVHKNMRPPIPTYCLPGLKRLMCVAWHRDPDSRPTFREVLEALRAEEAALA